MRLSTQIPSRNDPQAFFDAAAAEQKRQESALEAFYQRRCSSSCPSCLSLRERRKRAWLAFWSAFCITLGLGMIVVLLFG